MESTNLQENPSYPDLLDTEAEQKILENVVNPTIKTVILNECTEIEDIAYLIDLSEANRNNNITVQALECLNTFCMGGSVAIYIKIDSMVKGIGFGDEAYLFNVLPPMLKQLFGKDCTLYTKKFGPTFTEFNEYDASVVRIWLR